MTWVSTLSRPRWAMPSTISFTPRLPPRLMICSSAGISDSRAVEAEALGAGVFEVEELLEAFRLDELVEDRALALAGEGDLLVRPFDALLDPGLLGRVGDVHELDAERLAIGALAGCATISRMVRELQAEHVVDEDRAVAVGLGEAVVGRMQLLVVVARLEVQRDRDWREDGRARGRRGSASGRGPNRASPAGSGRRRSRRPCRCACALILSPTARSTAAQLPSSAETSSPFTGTGQFGRFQEAPRALFATSWPSSFRASKKARHSASTEFGSFS